MNGIKQEQSINDELLTKKQVYTDIFKISADSFSRDLEAVIPFITIGKRKKYSRKAVEQWIKDNQEYHQLPQRLQLV